MEADSASAAANLKLFSGNYSLTAIFLRPRTLRKYWCCLLFISLTPISLEDCSDQIILTVITS